MAIEIERKFLVANDGWKSSVFRTRRIRDGLLAMEDGCKTRVRISDGVATLGLKGQRTGLSRPEFEFEIPLADAEDILLSMCSGRVLAKARHLVEHAGVTWEIDVYEGHLSGVSMAEVELQREDQFLTLPPWVGREVTGDPKYAKVNMLAARWAAVAQ